MKPWVSFCISTFKRPSFISSQVGSLLRQTFPDFEIIISDNDPERSAFGPVEAFHDRRIRYFSNSENLGMIKSFNKSIERANGEFIVMVTDDDPVEVDFLAMMHTLAGNYPGYSLYGGFLRGNKGSDHVEVIPQRDFIKEVLDPQRTTWFLWSSCMVRRDAAIRLNGIPDYGSPHLADHAFIAKAGSVDGAVIINHAYSSLSSHDSNFSKFNFDYYVRGCSGFYEALIRDAKDTSSIGALKKHLRSWFVTSIFNLKKYYTIHKNVNNLKDIDRCATEIFKMEFMRHARLRFLIKGLIFNIKKATGLL